VKDRCPHLVRQMRTYRRLRSNKTGLNPRDARDEVLKCDDHAVDALRYGIFSEASIEGITPSAMAKQHTPDRFGVKLDQKARKKRGWGK